MARSDLMGALGLRDRMHFVEEYLGPAVLGGFLEMTIPDKPNSRLQKYRLTKTGKQAIRKMDKEKR
jgi:ATP-dependent DNA helicase RecG